MPSPYLILADNEWYYYRKGMTSQMEGEPLVYATHVSYLLEVGIHLLVGEDGKELPVLGGSTRAILLDDGLGDV